MQPDFVRANVDAMLEARREALAEHPSTRYGRRVQHRLRRQLLRRARRPQLHDGRDRHDGRAGRGARVLALSRLLHPVGCVRVRRLQFGHGLADHRRRADSRGSAAPGPSLSPSARPPTCDRPPRPWSRSTPRRTSRSVRTERALSRRAPSPTPRACSAFASPPLRLASASEVSTRSAPERLWTAPPAGGPHGRGRRDVSPHRRGDRGEFRCRAGRRSFSAAARTSPPPISGWPKWHEALTRPCHTSELEEWAHEEYFITDEDTDTFILLPPGGGRSRGLEQADGRQGDGLPRHRDRRGEVTRTRSGFADVFFAMPPDIPESLTPFVYKAPFEHLSCQIAHEQKIPFLGSIIPSVSRSISARSSTRPKSRRAG